MNLYRTTKIAGAAVVLLLSLTACGGGDSTAATDQGGSGGTQAGGQPDGQQNGSGGRFPGANGKIAAISGKTLQVQSESDGQTAVTYTDKTTITDQVSVAASDLKVGDCVRVTSDASPSSGSASSGSTPDLTTPVAATSVVISAKTDGTCSPVGNAGGPPNNQGGQQGSQQGQPPTDRPSGAPTGGPGGGGRFGMAGAFGEVTAISADGFTVSSAMPGNDGSQQATDRTVTTTSETKYLTTKTASASALKVGVCVSARGESDETGAVTAQSIAVSQAVDGTCQGGFMMRQQGS